MPITYSATDLIAELRGLGMIPNAGTTGSRTADMLRHLNAAAKHIFARLASERRNYFVKRQRVTVTAGSAKVRIPSRAFLNKLVELWWIEAGDRQFLREIPESEAYLLNDAGATRPAGYFFEENDITLMPDTSPAFSGAIEFAYLFEPSDLVALADTRQIAAGGIAGLQVTLGATPPTAWGAANTFDVHSSKPGAEVKKWDAPATLLGSVLTFADALDGSIFGERALEAGDYVCLAGECAILPFPRGLQPELVRQTAVRIAEAQGDAQAVQVHGANLQDQRAQNSSAMRPRIERRPIRISGRKGFL